MQRKRTAEKASGFRGEVRPIPTTTCLKPSHHRFRSAALFVPLRSDYFSALPCSAQYQHQRDDQQHDLQAIGEPRVPELAEAQPQAGDGA